MAYTTESSYTGNGSTTDFLVTFPFLESTDIKARVNGVDTSAFTVTGTTVTFTTAPPNTQAVLLYRNTDIDKTKVVFHAGASIRAQDLNNTSKQLLYAIQEEEQNTGGVAFAVGSKGQITVNTANSWVINNDVVTQPMMAANSIDSDQYVDGSIDRIHLEADIIDGSKIENTSIDSEHYVNGSIDHVHLSGDCIDGDNISDDAVDSEHYTDGSIDTIHISDNAITEDKIADATLLALKNPIGTVIWYAGSSAPSGYLKANGDTIANGSGTTQGITADFSALYAITGATLPDLRGEFVRGFDDGKGTDSGRSIRSAQAESYIAHSHLFCQDQQIGDEADYTDASGTSHDYERVGNSYDSDADSQSSAPASYSYRTLTDDRQTNTPGTETRPRNIALLACIKY